jgi:hypothetical protein
MDKDNDIFKDFLNQAQHSAQMGAAKMAVEQFKEIVPIMVTVMKTLYDELIEKGFTKQQAFQFTKEYSLKSFIQNQ